MLDRFLPFRSGTAGAAFHPALMHRLNATALTDRGERAYERLRELIVQGTLAPGTRLIESDLAAGLGMSRTPVRSALQRLQQEGLVHATGRTRTAGLLVAPLTRDDGTELLHIIGALEGLAARRAASLDAAGRERLAAALLEINRALGRAALAEPADPDVVLKLHTRFHARLLELPGMPRLRALLDAVEPQALRYRKLYSGSPREFVAEVAEHAVIIDGIARGDPLAGQRAVQENWSRAAQRLGRIIERTGEQGSW